MSAPAVSLLIEGKEERDENSNPIEQSIVSSSIMDQNAEKNTSLLDPSLLNPTSSDSALRYRRLKSACLQYNFDERAAWHPDKRVDTSELIKYVHSFLVWYRRLPSNVVEEIRNAGIFDEFESEFVHKMCVEEGEGAQSKADAIRARDPAAMKDPKEHITFNMYRALEKTKGATVENFEITLELLDNWHRTLLENVSTKRPGVRRSTAAQSDTVGAANHQYPPGDQVAAQMPHFVDKFCEMVPDILKSNSNNRDGFSIDELVEVIKWAAWSLVIGLALHPYYDGNGRLCRLLCNYALSSVFPFDIPVYNVYNPFTSRTDYVRVLIECQNCRCSKGANDGHCLTASQVIDEVNPGLMATMVLESCAYACMEFYRRISSNPQIASSIDQSGLASFDAIFPEAIWKNESDEVTLKLNGKKLFYDGVSILETNSRLSVCLSQTYKGSRINYVVKNGEGNELDKASVLCNGTECRLGFKTIVFEQCGEVVFEADVGKDYLNPVSLRHRFTGSGGERAKFATLDESNKIRDIGSV